MQEDTAHLTGMGRARKRRAFVGPGITQRGRVGVSSAVLSHQVLLSSTMPGEEKGTIASDPFSPSNWG